MGSEEKKKITTKRDNFSLAPTSPLSVSHTFGFSFCQRPWDLTKRWDDIAVADMVADMATDMEVHMVAEKVANMVANMEMDMVANIVADMVADMAKCVF